MSERPIEVWRRKLEHLQKAEATASDPAVQFTIGEQIKEAKRRLVELQADLTTENLHQPPSLDEVLMAYSDARLAEWDFAWTDPDDTDRLAYYVPPHYRLVKAEPRETNRPDRRFPKHGVLAEQALTEGEPATQRVLGADGDRQGLARTGFVMLRRAAKQSGESADATAIERTEAVLAVVACQMMVQDPNTYRVDGERQVARLRKETAERVAGGISTANDGDTCDAPPVCPV